MYSKISLWLEPLGLDLIAQAALRERHAMPWVNLHRHSPASVGCDDADDRVGSVSPASPFLGFHFEEIGH